MLVIIPSLAVGGAEMDLLRNLPRLDRAAFEIIVFTFLANGALASQLAAAGIEIVGPFAAIRFNPLSLAKRAVRNFARKLAQFSRSILSMWSLAPKSIRRSFRALMFWIRLNRSTLPMSGFGRMLRSIRGAIGRLCSTGRAGLSWLFRNVILLCNRLVGLLPKPIARLAYMWPRYIVIGLGLVPFIRARRVDVIHTVLPNSYVVGSIASFLTGRRPLIMSRVGLNWYQRRDIFYYYIERRLCHGLVKAATGNCGAILEELRSEGIPEAKLRVVQNGIDYADFLRRMPDRDGARECFGLPRSAIVISVVANLHGYKGHADLLQALHGVKHVMPEWILLVVGRDVDGNRARFEQICMELEIERRVRFLGERDDIPSILSAADIHVSCSHTEGLPNNIVEAMCANLPVIATSVGGVSELIVDRQNGLVVPPHNPVKLGRALLELARDGTARQRMGECGRKHVLTHFSIERSVSALERLYSDAVPAVDLLKSAPLREVARRTQRVCSEAMLVTTQAGLVLRRYGANLASRVSDGPVSRMALGSWTSNFLIRRRLHLQMKSFNFMFYDPTTVNPRSYRPHPYRILMIVPSLGRGGAERMMIATAAGLVQRGYQVRILALQHPLQQPDFSEELERYGLDYRVCQGNAMPFSAWWRRFRIEALRPYAADLEEWHYNLVAEIAVEIEDYRPTIVHGWLNFSILIAGPVAHLLGVPRFIGGQHDILDEAKRVWAVPHVEAYRAVADLPNATLTNVCAAGARVYERWLDRPEHSVKVLPNMFWPDSVRPPSREQASDYRRELGIPEEAQVVSTVTRMIEAKDPLLSVETAAQIARVRSDVWFVFAGYGELAETVSERVRELGLSDRVILPGAVSDVGLIYAISDVFLFTSRAEAAPIVLLEAQSTGRASVTSDVGGIREMVLDGITARVIASRSATEFAEAVLAILDDREWRSRAGEVGPILVAERFGPDQVLDATLALYGLSSPSVRPRLNSSFS